MAARARRTGFILGGVALLVAAVAAAAGLALGGADFLRQHWAPLLLCSTLCTLFITLIFKTAGIVVRGAILAIRRPRALGQSGAAMAEFVIVVIPFLLTLTALMQLSLASLARVLVSYSAFCAARAAIVLVPLETNGAGQPGKNNTDYTGRIGYGANTRIDFAISKKASFIRNAAAYAMIPASPSIDIVVTDTIRNGKEYLKNRGTSFLVPALVDLIVQAAKLPPAMEQVFSEKVKDAIKGGLDTPAQKAAAKQKLEAVIDTLPEGQREAARQSLFNYIDNYKGGDGSPTGLAGDWVKGTMDDTLQGPLEKFRDGVLDMFANGMSGMGGVAKGGNFTGYTVDRALDAGFGAGTDGAGGAILRSLRKLIYARIATVVTLRGADGSVKSKFAAGEPITAQVTHLYYCQIPLANRIAGKPFYDMPWQTQLEMTTGPVKYGALVGLPGYFMPMTARHTLINQGKP